jgi:hypothetical protein
MDASLRPGAHFFLAQGLQRLFVAGVFGLGAALVFPPHGGGWIFFGAFAIVAGVVTIYALGVCLMVGRMRLTVSGGTISYGEYFRARSVPVNQATAFQLKQGRGQYGPGVLEGLILGTNGQPIIHGMAARGFDPVDLVRLAYGIHKPIRGEPDLIAGWIRPALARHLGLPESEHRFPPGDAPKILEAARSRMASGRLEIRCPRRTISIDFINGRQLRTAGMAGNITQCAVGTSRFIPLATPAETLTAISATLPDAFST